MLNQEVRKIMTLNPVVAHPNETVAEVSSKMVNQKVQQMPVVDEDHKLLGMITSYDLWRTCREGIENENQLIGEVMSTNVIFIEPKDKVGTAAELFIDKRFKTLPVVNIDNKLKGVITAFDVIKHVVKKEYPPHLIMIKDEVIQ